MLHKPEKETWLEFMARAKKNRLSPTMQEQVDRERAKKNKELK